MKLYRPSDVAQLLQRLDFRPSRILGQNFLVDGNILDILLQAADVQPDEAVLEVGPGLGIVTGPLLTRAARVVAIEKDDRLYAHLKEAFADADQLTLIHADALAVDLDALLAEGVTKLVANLPYSIASRLMIDLSESDSRPNRMVVTVQQEVADRLAAVPGTKAFGVISVLIQHRYRVRIVKVISENCFFPKPKIRSAIVQLDLHDDATARNNQGFKDLVKFAFSRRRKQLTTILPGVPGIAGLDKDGARELCLSTDIQPDARPETLSVADWIRLTDAISPHEC